MKDSLEPGVFKRRRVLTDALTPKAPTVFGCCSAGGLLAAKRFVACQRNADLNGGQAMPKCSAR
jgi:hypothetical protein